MLKRMLSGCISSSSLHHCWEVSCVICHSHRYMRFIACASHLSFLVLALSLIIFWMGCPSVGCKFIEGVLLVFVSWGRVVDIMGVMGMGIGNNMAACFRASLISFGACLYLVRNSWGWGWFLFRDFGFEVGWWCHICKIYLVICGFWRWSFPWGWRSWSWLSKTIIMEFFYGEWSFCGRDMYFVFSFQKKERTSCRWSSTSLLLKFG